MVLSSKPDTVSLVITWSIIAEFRRSFFLFVWRSTVEGVSKILTVNKLMRVSKNVFGYDKRYVDSDNFKNGSLLIKKLKQTDLH